MIKRRTGTGSWCMFDVFRGQSDAVPRQIFADSSGAERYGLGDAPGVDFTSTGVTGQGADSNTNTNTETYVYIAFA